MTTPAPDEPELAAFLALYDFGFDDFQLTACRALNEGRGVLVAAPTGSGKTVIGEFAVHLALAEGRKCFYTTPIKALSNQKYADLVRRYSAAKVGLLTGDNSVNGEAPVVVMTTEVLRNMLYAGSPTLAGLGYVVLDEVHYLADAFRGAVWEEVIIHLPEPVRLVALSATVSNAEEFGDWLTQVRGGTKVIVDEHRPVPLWQHMMVGARLYDLFTGTGDGDGDGAKINPELSRIAQRDEWAQRGAPGRPVRGTRRPARFRPARRADVIERLDTAGLLPAITFIFSRAGCDAAVLQCLDSGLRLTTPTEADKITEIARERTADIPETDLRVLGYADWLTGLRRGIAAHHAGMLPAFKQVVEELFTAGLIRAVFATETLALGINMPARTVVIERTVKWNGESHADLTPGEYTQLTGRAGRRGIDIEGHAVVLWQPGVDPVAVAGLASTRTYPLSSSFRPSYNMAVNLLGQVGRQRAAALLESSFAQFRADRAVVGSTRQARKLRQAMAEAVVSCDRGDFAEYARLRAELSEREGEASRQRSAAQRAEALASLRLLRRGDIIRVPSGRRAGIALVLETGQASPSGGSGAAGRPGGSGVAGAARRSGGSGATGRPRGSGAAGRSGEPAGSLAAGRPGESGQAGGSRAADGGTPAPLVLTADRQVKRLSVTDFPVPVTPIDRIPVPRGFSVRSANHRRDLASTLRNKLAGLDLGKPQRRGDSGQTAAASAEIERLRRRLRQHPCHACPDREMHARQAGQYLRLQREVEALERRVASRTHVISRTFGRVCAVLDQLGYTNGDKVTAAGRRLAGLYSELDLLVAECLRRGIWEELTPAELAACVSALTFESRGPDDASPPRLPHGQVRRVLDTTIRIWAELESVEQEHELSFLRELDPHFAWTAHAWAGGQPLERLLSPDLTAGDFVRAVKQLIDLLDQITAVAGQARVARTAQAAVTALRRGVVAYSSLG
jgi:ATP-dependent RNA helicase HelY